MPNQTISKNNAFQVLTELDKPTKDYFFTLKERGIPQLVLHSWYLVVGKYLVGGFIMDTHNCVDTPQRILDETLER